MRLSLGDPLLGAAALDCGVLQRSACYDALAMDDSAISQLLVKELPDLLAVYRFGSTVSGETHRDSDVDIAVLCAAPLSAERQLTLRDLLESELHRTVDVIDLVTAPTVLRMQVVTTGMTILVRDKRSQSIFEDLTYSQYARLNEERRDIVAQVLRERSVHGR